MERGVYRPVDPDRAVQDTREIITIHGTNLNELHAGVRTRVFIEPAGCLTLSPPLEQSDTLIRFLLEVPKNEDPSVRILAVVPPCRGWRAAERRPFTILLR